MPENEFTYSWEEMPKLQLPVVNLAALALQQLNDVVATVPCLCSILKMIWAGELRLSGSTQTCMIIQESRGCTYPGPPESTLVCTQVNNWSPLCFSRPTAVSPSLVQYLCSCARCPTSVYSYSRKTWWKGWFVLTWKLLALKWSIKLSPPKRHRCH